MKTTNVFFDFQTKDEWIIFCQKILSGKEFEKNFPAVFNISKKCGTEYIIELFYKEEVLAALTYLFYFSTRSKKTLTKLIDWIKENHYENNYVLRDMRGNKIYMDELFKWYNERKENLNLANMFNHTEE